MLAFHAVAKTTALAIFVSAFSAGLIVAEEGTLATLELKFGHNAGGLDSSSLVNEFEHVLGQFAGPSTRSLKNSRRLQQSRDSFDAGEESVADTARRIVGYILSNEGQTAVQAPEATSGNSKSDADSSLTKDSFFPFTFFHPALVSKILSHGWYDMDASEVVLQPPPNRWPSDRLGNYPEEDPADAAAYTDESNYPISHPMDEGSSWPDATLTTLGELALLQEFLTSQHGTEDIDAPAEAFSTEKRSLEAVKPVEFEQKPVAIKGCSRPKLVEEDSSLDGGAVPLTMPRMIDGFREYAMANLELQREEINRVLAADALYSYEEQHDDDLMVKAGSVDEGVQGFNEGSTPLISHPAQGMFPAAKYDVHSLMPLHHHASARSFADHAVELKPSFPVSSEVDGSVDLSQLQAWKKLGLFDDMERRDLGSVGETQPFVGQPQAQEHDDVEDKEPEFEKFFGNPGALEADYDEYRDMPIDLVDVSVALSEDNTVVRLVLKSSFNEGDFQEVVVSLNKYVSSRSGSSGFPFVGMTLLSSMPVSLHYSTVVSGSMSVDVHSRGQWRTARLLDSVAADWGLPAVQHTLLGTWMMGIAVLAAVVVVLIRLRGNGGDANCQRYGEWSDETLTMPILSAAHEAQYINTHKGKN